MRRGPLFLAATLIEVLRFFILMFVAEAVGLLQSASLAPSVIRHIASAQLLFVALFFFLWIDRGKYAQFRPLGLVGKAVSLASFVPLLLAFAGFLRSEGFIPLPGPALASAFAVVVADLAGVAILALYRRGPASLAGPGGPAPEATAAPPATAPAAAIERVEDLH